MRYLPESDEVEFTVTMGSMSWFGLALGDIGMSPGTDMISFHRGFDGADYDVNDRVSIGYQPPDFDESNDLIQHPGNAIEMDNDSEDKATIFIRRRLDTGDMQDFVIPLDEEFFVGYAVNHVARDRQPDISEPN